MFKFLKEKLKSAVSKISEKIEEEGKKEEIVATVEEKIPEQPKSHAQSKHEQEKIGEQYSKQEPILPAPEPVIPPESKTIEQQAEQAIPKEEKKGFFSSITSIFKKKEEQPVEEHKEDKLEEAQETKEIIFPAIEEAKEEAKQHQEPEIKEPDVKEVEHVLAEPAKPIEKKAETKEIPKPQPQRTKHEQRLKPKQPTPPIPKQIPKIQPAKVQPQATEKPEPKSEQKPHEPKSDQKKEKKGFFSALKEKILTTTINDQQFEDMFFDLELALLENNVAVEVIDKIKHDLKSSLVQKPIKRNKVEETVILTLKDSVQGLFNAPFDLISTIKTKAEKPFIISFVGINGSGKTTSIAKMASLLKDKGFSVVLAAGDTFRAASIEQLAVHGEKLGVKVVKHDYGADPAAVAFDAIKHAQAKGVDVVLIDTAGRMHSNTDLVNEMKKIMRVAKPDLKIFVGESITGNDCVEQAKTFNEAIGIDGIILSKADIDEKGGAAVSVSYVTKKPILYIGTGQEYKDIKPFDAAMVMENLGLEE